MFAYIAVGLGAFFAGLLMATVWPLGADPSAITKAHTPPPEWLPPWVGPRFRCANCKCKWCVLGEQA